MLLENSICSKVTNAQKDRFHRFSLLGGFEFQIHCFVGLTWNTRGSWLETRNRNEYVDGEEMVIFRKMKVERENTRGRKVQAQKRVGWGNEGVGVFTKMEGP